MPVPSVSARTLVVFLLAAAGGTGCAPEPEIRAYDAPKATGPTTAPEPPTPAKVRLLAAMIPTPAEPNFSWFVKMVGPISAVDAAEKDFDAFLASLKPTGNETAPLLWAVPAGWTADTSNANRLVTLTGPPTAPLQVTVSGPFGGTVASNVNRWRTLDAGLKKVSDAEARKAVAEVTVGTLKAYRVELRGPGPDKKSPMSGG